MAEKLEYQKEQRALEASGEKKRRELFERQDEIQQRRDNLIDELEKQLEQQITTRTILSCEWELKYFLYRNYFIENSSQLIAINLECRE